MSLTIQLAPAFEAKVVAAAQARGMSPEQFALEAVIAKTALTEEEVEELEDAHDLAIVEHRLAYPSDEPNRSLDELRAAIRGAQPALGKKRND